MKPSSLLLRGSNLSIATVPMQMAVTIEVPRWGFLKRGSSGHVDFVSPLPCPFNYGGAPGYVGLDNDLLDAVVLGPRLPFGTCVRVPAWGAITLTDRGMSDDKLICSYQRPTVLQCLAVLTFFHFYAGCKGMLNLWRGRPGRNACDGWCELSVALGRARPCDETWDGPTIRF